MKRYQIYLYGEKVSSIIIGLDNDCLYEIDGDKITKIGTNVVKTRKGFTFLNVFYNRQFVAWSRLKSLD